MENTIKNPVRLYNVSHPNPGAPIKDKDSIVFKVPPQGQYVVVEDRVARRIIGTHTNQRKVPYFSMRAPETNERAVDNRDAIIELQSRKLAELEARLAELEEGNEEEQPEAVTEDNVVDTGEYLEEEDLQNEEELPIEEEVEEKEPPKRGRKSK